MLRVLLALVLGLCCVFATNAQSLGSSAPNGSSTPKTTQTCSGAQTLNFASYGDTAYEVTLTGNCTVTIVDPGTPGTLRRITVIIHPASYQATLPASSSSLLWSGGSAPVPSTTTDTIIIFESTGAGRIYAYVQFP